MSLLGGSSGGGSAPQAPPTPQPSLSFYTPYTPDSISPTSISRFRGDIEGEEEDDTLFSNPFSTKVSRKERSTIAGTSTFDPSMQQTNLFGFATGQLLGSGEDPNNQFTTRQRTSGGVFEEDTVSFLPQRSL
jgi:hypothetical protein